MSLMNARRLFGLLAFLVLFSSGKVAGQVSHLNTNKHESKTFKFASFKQTHFHALLTKKLESHSVFHSDDCSFLCLKTKRCVSFNIQAEKNENPLLECELLDDDRFHSSEKFQKNGTFHHFAIQTQCMTDPCKNRGKCLPDYESNGYRCNCSQPYIGNNCETRVKNCAEYYEAGDTASGVYKIDPDNLGAFEVFCDQIEAGGGWTVFQKRLDGSVDFYRGWADYKQGFGNLTGEFWLGLDKINRLTSQSNNNLLVELEDVEGNTAYAEYEAFAVSSEESKYRISFGSYTGTAGDSLSYHSGMAFSTKDQDNDLSSRSCALTYKGAWWYKGCHFSNLNGLYHRGQHSSFADGVNWHSWKGSYYSAKRAEMKMRPDGF